MAEESLSKPPSDSSHASATSCSSGAINPQQSHIGNFFQTLLGGNSAHARVITKAIAFYICKDIQLYSAMEGEGFEYLLSVLEPRYKKPGRKVFAEREIPELYQKVKKGIAESLHNARTVALTVDGWTSCATDSFVTVTAQYIDDKWALQNYVLQTCRFTEAHPGKNLAALLQEVFSEWNLEDKKIALVTDNASNMLPAAALAKMKLHVRCVAHLLNLASQKALKVEKVLELLIKMRKVSVFWRIGLLNKSDYTCTCAVYMCFIHSFITHPFRW